MIEIYWSAVQRLKKIPAPTVEATAEKVRRTNFRKTAVSALRVYGRNREERVGIVATGETDFIGFIKEFYGKSRRQHFIYCIFPQRNSKIFIEGKYKTQSSLNIRIIKEL